MNQLTYSNELMSSTDLALLLIGESKDAHSDLKKKIRRTLPNHQDYVSFYTSKQNKRLECYLLPRRECILLAASYDSNVVARVYDAWEAQTNKSMPKQFSQKELLLMQLQSIEKIEEQQAIIQQKQAVIEQKNEKISSMENLFYDGGTIAQFCKQLNGVNVQQVNKFFLQKWLYKDARNSWRVMSRIRDIYLTEREVSVSRIGQHLITNYQ